MKAVVQSMGLLKDSWYTRKYVVSKKRKERNLYVTFVEKNTSQCQGLNISHEYKACTGKGPAQILGLTEKGF